MNRLERTLSHIEQNLDEPLKLTDLCQVANLSQFHFHRQFQAYFGLSVYNAIKQLRLKRAANQLAYRKELKIIDIALNNGFQSAQAFSRAFHHYTNQTPRQFRASPDWQHWHFLQQPITQLRKEKMNTTTHYNIEIIDFASTQVALMLHRGEIALLNRTLGEFIGWRKKNQLPPSKSRTFNVVYDDPRITRAKDFRFGLACSVEHDIDETSQVKNYTIDGGKCALLRLKGNETELEAAIDYLYTHWLAETKQTLKDQPLFLERIRFFPDVPECDALTYIYLPLN